MKWQDVAEKVLRVAYPLFRRAGMGFHLQWLPDRKEAVLRVSRPDPVNGRGVVAEVSVVPPEINVGASLERFKDGVALSGNALGVYGSLRLGSVVRGCGDFILNGQVGTHEGDVVLLWDYGPRKVPGLVWAKEWPWYYTFYLNLTEEVLGPYDVTEVEEGGPGSWGVDLERMYFFEFQPMRITEHRVNFPGVGRRVRRVFRATSPTPVPCDRSRAFDVTTIDVKAETIPEAARAVKAEIERMRFRHGFSAKDALLLYEERNAAMSLERQRKILGAEYWSVPYDVQAMVKQSPAVTFAGTEKDRGFWLLRSRQSDRHALYRPKDGWAVLLVSEGQLVEGPFLSAVLRGREGLVGGFGRGGGACVAGGLREATQVPRGGDVPAL